jgi:uncharacterized cupredoxin-like copper-binding protein
MDIRRFTMVLMLVGALTFALAACSSSDESGEPSYAPSSSDTGADAMGGIATTLKDFAITPATTSASAGEITFDVTNDGPSDHEMVIIKTDLAPDALPTDSKGEVVEDEVEAVDEVEDVAPGSSVSLSVNLEAGSYVLICNLPGHYAAGMSAAFTVN